MARRLLTAADFAGNPQVLFERNLTRCRERLESACDRAGRSTGEVEILVVSKYVDNELTRVLYDLGVRDFGENRVQEGLRKREMLDASTDSRDDARVHFIGHVQRNKARRSVTAFSTIQSLNSLRLADAMESHLEELRPADLALFVEVNVSGEEQKTGLPVKELPRLLDDLAELPQVSSRLIGLMGMAPYDEDPQKARPHFRRLRELRDDATARGRLPPDAKLSMGMSSDFEVAIEEGATVVRVGSMLFEP